MDEFLLPLIGELRLNLVLNPKRCPGAKHKTQSPLDGLDSDALTHKQDDSKSGMGGGRKEAKKVEMGGEMRWYCVTEL